MRLALLTTDNREPFRQYDRPEPWFGTAPEALLQGLAQVPELEVHVVSCTQQPMRSPEKLAPNIWFHSLWVPKIGWLRTGYLGCIRAVRRKLRQLQPHIVHGQGTERDCAISAVFSGYPAVVTVHGNMRLIARVNRAPPFSFQWFAALLEGPTLRRARGVVCITRYTQEAVRRWARKTWVVPNAVDSAFFRIDPAPVDPPLLLCLGNIQVRKNQLTLIRALDGLAGKRTFRLLFLGQAERGTAFAEEFFKLLETRPWCRYGGLADRAAVRQHLQAATLLVLPSLEDNCPMAVLEAMAAGVPVVATKVGGVPDLIEDGVTGLFCDPHDPASMRQAVERLLADGALRAALVARARAVARDRFHPERIARRHLEIYREVLSSTGL